MCFNKNSGDSGGLLELLAYSYDRKLWLLSSPDTEIFHIERDARAKTTINVMLSKAQQIQEAAMT